MRGVAPSCAALLRGMLVFAVFVAVGCAEKHTPQPAVPTVVSDAPEAQRKALELRPGLWRYTTRGVVLRLPAPKADLAVRHEALTAFYSREGVNIGMESMPMDFPNIAPGVSLGGVQVGDKIVFDFDVDWSTREVWVVTRLVKLPKETQLSFKKTPG